MFKFFQNVFVFYAMHSLTTTTTQKKCLFFFTKMTRLKKIFFLTKFNQITRMDCIMFNFKGVEGPNVRAGSFTGLIELIIKNEMRI